MPYALHTHHVSINYDMRKHQRRSTTPRDHTRRRPTWPKTEYGSIDKFQVLKSSSPQVLRSSKSPSPPLRLNHKHIPSHSKYTMRQCKHLQRPLRPCWKPPPCHTPTTKFVPPTRTKPCNPWPVARARAPPQPAETTLDEPSRPAPSAGHDCSDGTYTPTGTCHPMRRPRQPGQPHTRRRAHITDKIAISKTRQRQPRTTATTAALQRCGMASHNLPSKVSTGGWTAAA